MQFLIKKISENEIEDFLSVLKEAALWLRNEGKEMWNDRQLSTENLLKNGSIGQMYIGYLDNETVAVMLLQEEDRLLWPDSNGDSLFLHKLAVRRNYAKQGFSIDMVNWAKSQARSLNKRYLRLDCAAERPSLCEFYEKQGFRKVSERVMFGKYPTAFYEFEI